jgi:hypothetical protein
MDTDKDNSLTHKSKHNFWQIVSNKLFVNNIYIKNIDIIDKKISKNEIQLKRMITVNPDLPWLLRKIFDIETISYTDNITIDLENKKLVAITDSPFEISKYGSFIETQTIYELDNQTISNVNIKYTMNGIFNLSAVQSLYKSRRNTILESDMLSGHNIKTEEVFKDEINSKFK